MAKTGGGSRKVIGDALLKIAPSLEDFQAELERKLKAIRVTKEVNLDVNTTEFKAKVKKALEEVSKNLTIDMDVRTAKASGKIRNLREREEKRGIQLNTDADTKKAKRKIKEARAAAEAKPAEISVEAKVAKAEAAVAKVKAELEALNEEIKLGLETKEAERKLAELEIAMKLVRGNIKMDADTAKAHAELSMLQARARRMRGRIEIDVDDLKAKKKLEEAKMQFRVVQNFAGVNLFNLGNITAAAAGIMGVVGALGGVIAGATAAATALGVMGGAVAIGSSGVFGAFTELWQESKPKAAKKASDDLTDSLREQREAWQRVADAQRSARNAAEDLADNQKRLQDATKDATREIRDQRLELEDSEHSQERAAINLARARQNLGKVRYEYSQGKASRLDVQEAELGVRESQSRLRSAQYNVQDTREKANTTYANGVQNAPGVVEARRNVRNSAENLQTAEREARDAVSDATATANKKAQGAEEGPSRFEQALKKLSPNAQQFVKDIRALGGAWHALRMATQDTLFDGLGESFSTFANQQMPEFRNGMTILAGVANQQLKGTFDALNKTFNEFTENGMAAEFWEKTASSFRNFAPVIDSIARALTIMMIESGDQIGTFFGALATFLEDGAQMWGEFGGQTFEWLGRILPMINRFFEILMPMFEATLPALEQIFAAINQVLGNNDDLLMNLVSNLGGAIANLIVAAAPLLTMVMALMTGFLQAIEWMPGWLLGGAFAIFMIVKSVLTLTIGFGNLIGRIMAAVLSIKNLITVSRLFGQGMRRDTESAGIAADRLAFKVGVIAGKLKGQVGPAAAQAFGTLQTKASLAGVAAERAFRNVGQQAGVAASQIRNATTASERFGIISTKVSQMSPFMKIVGILGTVVSLMATLMFLFGAGDASAATMGESGSEAMGSMSSGMDDATNKLMTFSMILTTLPMLFMSATARQKALTAASAVFGAVWSGMKASGAFLIGLPGMLWNGLKAMKAVIAASRVWTGVQLALNAVMSMNPIALVVIAIAALVAGIIYAYTHFEGFRNVVKKIWELFLDWNPISLLVKGIKWIVENFDILTGAFSFLGELWDKVWGFLKRGAQNMGDLFSKVGRTIISAFQRVAEVLKTPIHLVGRLLSWMGNLSLLGKKLPGSDNLRTVGERLQKLRAGGDVPAGVDANGWLYGPGGPREDKILGVDPKTGQPTAFVSPEEYVVNAHSAHKYAPLVEAINRDDPRLAGLARLDTGGRPNGQAMSRAEFDTAWHKYFARYANITRNDEINGYDTEELKAPNPGDIVRSGNDGYVREAYLKNNADINRLYRAGQMPPTFAERDHTLYWADYLKRVVPRDLRPHDRRVYNGDKAPYTPEQRDKWFEKYPGIRSMRDRGQLPPSQEDVNKQVAREDKFNSEWDRYLKSKMLNGDNPENQRIFWQNNPQLRANWKEGKLPPDMDQNWHLDPSWTPPKPEDGGEFDIPEDSIDLGTGGTGGGEMSFNPEDFSGTSGAEFGAPAEKSALQRAADTAVNSGKAKGIDVAVAISDPKTGESYIVGGEKTMPSASAIKLAVALAAAKKVDDGSLKLDEIKGDLNPMISNSDNEATNRLIDKVGGLDAVNQAVAGFGISANDVRIGRKLGIDFEGEDPNRMTVVGANALLGEIYKSANGNGNVGQKPAQAIMDAMRAQSVDTKFGAVLPNDHIAHKTGELGGASHDMGYVFDGDKWLAVSIMTNKSGAANQADNNAIIQQFAKDVYANRNSSLGQPQGDPTGGGGDGSGLNITGATEFAKSMDGVPYQMGGFSRDNIDCSGMVSAVVNVAKGLDPFDSRMNTVTERDWLKKKGALEGTGSDGDLRIGWWDQGGGANGHTAGTFPGGLNFESTGPKVRIGGPVGYNDKQFTDHMYFPGGGATGVYGSGSFDMGGQYTDPNDPWAMSGEQEAQSDDTYTPEEWAKVPWQDKLFPKPGMKKAPDDEHEKLSVPGYFGKAGKILGEGLLDFVGLGGSILSEGNDWNKAINDTNDWFTDPDRKGDGKKVPDAPEAGNGSPYSPQGPQLNAPTDGTQSTVPAPTSGDPAKTGPNRDRVKHALKAFGWSDGPEWAAAEWIKNKESGPDWNNTKAQNPNSTAYGLFQFLDSTWGTVGMSKTDDPFLQGVAFGKYIKGTEKYGTPSKAQSHHEAQGWYADGGWVSGPGGPRDDKVAAWLSNEEFVVNARSAAAAGGLLDVINDSPENAGRLASAVAMAAAAPAAAIPGAGPAISAGLVAAAPMIGELTEHGMGGLAVGAETLARNGTEFLSKMERDRLQTIQTLGGAATKAPLNAKVQQKAAPSSVRNTSYGDIYALSSRDFIKQVEKKEAAESFAHIGVRPPR